MASSCRYYHEHRRGFAIKVCDICFKTNPQDEELMRVHCRTGPLHRGAPTVLVTWSTNKFKLVEIRPLPNTPLASGSGYTLCNKIASCGYAWRCTYAHSEEEKTVWNTQLNWKRRQPHAEEPARLQQTIGTAGAHAHATRFFFSHANIKESYQKRCQNPPKVEDGRAPLTRQTYCSKFYSLLHYEEEEHVNLLSDKCDGEYQLTTYERGNIPPWVRRGDQCSRYGCLSGMRGDQIMYASQASGCVFIVDQSGVNVCSAEILSENMRGHYDEMLIEFKDVEASKLEGHFDLTVTDIIICRAEFEVKHFYFDLLRKSLRSLTAPQMCKVMPTSSQPQLPPGHNSVLPSVLLHSPYDFMKLDRESQQSALQMVVNSTSQDPVLISGAFGTGKTRLLAVATYHFIEEGKQKKVPTRVLLCCHQQATADTFIEEYFGKMIENNDNPWRVQLARITRARYFAKSAYPRVYLNLHEFQNTFSSEYAKEDFVVIVTTLLTGLNLRYTVSDKFFTHILFDEAAQAREPEAVAPLSMASQDTKIVIAGDDRQVGPEILVLGETARINGLSKSLFTRLLEYYSKNELPVAVLNTNYRCHKSIVSLARKLFYSHGLKSDCPNRPSSISHPISFVCSSLEQPSITNATNKVEADALISRLNFSFKDIGDMKDVCIMATNRQQLSDIKNGLQKQNWRSLIPAQFLPTYSIQGEEFTALFISTVESLDPSGCPFDPTKSLCNPSVFNTAITRAKSLILVVGNPYVLMHTEMQMGSKKNCWAEYLHMCFKTKSVVLARHEMEKSTLQDLRLFVEGRVNVQKCIEENSTKRKEQKFENEAVCHHLQHQPLRYEQDKTKSEKYQLQKEKFHQLQETDTFQEQQMTREIEKRELHTFQQQQLLKTKEKNEEKNTLEEEQRNIREKGRELQETIYILEQKTKEKLQATVHALEEQQQKTREKQEELEKTIHALQEQEQKTKEKEEELRKTVCALEEQQQRIRDMEEELQKMTREKAEANRLLEQQSVQQQEERLAQNEWVQVKVKMTGKQKKVEPLGIDKLVDVLNALENVNDWHSLGLQLGILYPTLEKIKTDNNKSDRCKTEMIAAWLNKEYDDLTFGVPSWSVLKAALRKIKENTVADQI